MEAELQTKLVISDEFSGHWFKDITNDERPPVEEDSPAAEEMVLVPSSGSQEIHPTGGRHVTGKTTIVAGEAGRWTNKISNC